ncbi:MAG: cytochrome c oxidase assembly protein, partial [Chloroflexota bacterium]
MGIALVCGLFWWQRGSAEARHWRALSGAVLLTLLALESPLDYVADRDLFSAHMLQHLLLLLGVAPLLALSVPPAAAEKLARAVPR